ncbi:N-acetylmuramate alpha-1-phosphate uridylyltransferase MurU [Aliikangiella sp. G2MR2-5]|uniref:N-acetylmuramate alpha-1-phosphate uridylyltransferase MurU n=1 Tax=Aliikangiella sp. G2MR2-5 TaxID=2788943 RepID=UPI00352F4ED9
MILAAGRGERMMPLTAKTPKPLLLVNGKPLIQYHLESLRQANIKDVVINVSYLGEQIMDYFGDGSALNINIHWSIEETPLETAGGIIKARSMLGESPFLLLNGDIWCDINIEKLVASPQVVNLEQNERVAHLILVNNPVHNLEGDFGIEEGLLTNAGSTKWTYAGISLLSHRLFSQNEFSNAQPLPLAPLLREFADKKMITAEHYSGEWLDVGTPERLEQLRQMQSRLK